jgi:hypothetical protein
MRADTTSQIAGCLTFNTARNELVSASNLIEQFNVGQLDRRASNSAAKRLAGFCPTSDENESSTEFQNGAWNLFPNAPKNLAENRAVYITNSAL